MIRLEDSPNLHSFEAFYRCNTYLSTHNKILVSISGGADSDVMLDLMIRVAKDENISLDKFHFVFFDTGIEYQATKEHLDYLEDKYNIKIERMRAITPVPLGCRKYGLPFLSKYASEMIERLQKHNFKFEDKSFEVLLEEYPKCKVALKWWCNQHETKNDGVSKFNINYNKHLKEFMIANPPTFKISNKCCKGAKKDNAHKAIKEKKIDLNCVGIRKSEGGARSSAYKSCFSEKTDMCDYANYRPIFWFNDKDKKEYEDFFGVKHSDCYCKYGLKRTGCVGCPFGKNFEFELENAKQYEPRLYEAVNNIFKDSYEYTRKFIQFKKEKENKNENN